MAIILDEENNVVTVENQPEAKRTLFKNISDGNGGAIDEILERLDRIYPGTNAGFISSTGAIQNATADAEVYTDEFPVTPGNKITVTLKYSQDRSMWLAYCLYDASHTFISLTMLVNSVTQSNATVTFTVPDGAYYCRLTYRSFNDANLTVNTTGQRLFDVQLSGLSLVKDGVALIPIASTTRPGAIMMGSPNGTGLQVYGRILYIVRASSADCKAGTNDVKPIVPLMQHESAFYALAKAAGDTTQAASDNAVGNYTDQAKTAIQKMLGVSNKLELLQTVTTTEDLEEINFDISTTPCVKLFATVETPANGSSSQVIRASMRRIDNVLLTLMYLYNIDRTTQKTYAAFMADSTSGRHFSDQRTGNYSLTNGALVVGRPDMFGFIENAVYDTTVQFYGSVYPTGTTISLYGVRI